MTARLTDEQLDASEVIALAREVQERRDTEAKWEAIRQTVNCPTCGGSGVETDDSMAVVGVPGGQYPVGPCPGCTDGHPPMEKVLTVGAAAFVALAERDQAYAARENGDVANWRAMRVIEAAVRP